MTQKYKVFINNELHIISKDWKRFCKDYILIDAAGGVVFNERSQLLMIFRNGKWDLPKGKLELGETIEECAIREVKEECGITKIDVVSQLSETYHTYVSDQRKILKRTFWFKMKAGIITKFTPQKEEGITKVCWVHQKNIMKKLNNSYMNLKDVLFYE